MNIFTEAAFPTPAVVGNDVLDKPFETSVPGMSKLELFTLHAMGSVINSYQGILREHHFIQIARVSRLIAEATLEGLEKTKTNGL
jgi:hypothetical protein